jgi:hypothetical protein
MPTSNKYTKAKQNMFDIWQKMWQNDSGSLDSVSNSSVVCFILKKNTQNAYISDILIQ